MKQIYHHYLKWECYKNGMWRRTTKEEIDQHLQSAIVFTGSHEMYGNAMTNVCNNWKYSIDHHLSDKNINRKAYIGHAACNFEHGWSEGLVRMAWWHLTDEQRELANLQALRAIECYEENRKSFGIIQLKLF